MSFPPNGGNLFDPKAINFGVAFILHNHRPKVQRIGRFSFYKMSQNSKPRFQICPHKTFLEIQAATEDGTENGYKVLVTPGLAAMIQGQIYNPENYSGCLNIIYVKLLTVYPDFIQEERNHPKIIEILLELCPSCVPNAFHAFCRVWYSTFLHKKDCTI